MQRLLAACGVAVVTFAVIVAVYVGNRMDATTIALLSGAVVGICVTIPATVAIVLILVWRNRHPPDDHGDHSSYELTAPASWQRPQLQLPVASPLVRIDPHTMIREQQIEANALRIYQALYPHDAPTRENIRSSTGLLSNAQIGSALDWLAEQGIVSDGQAGKERTWIQ